MPMKSQAQRRYLWATHPEIARRWEKHTPKGKKLPEKVKRAMDIRTLLAFDDEIQKIKIAMSPQEQWDYAQEQLHHYAQRPGGLPDSIKEMLMHAHKNNPGSPIPLLNVPGAAAVTQQIPRVSETAAQMAASGGLGTTLLRAAPGGTGGAKPPTQVLQRAVTGIQKVMPQSTGGRLALGAGLVAAGGLGAHHLMAKRKQRQQAQAAGM